MESWEKRARPLLDAEVETSSWGTRDAMRARRRATCKRHGKPPRIGVERAFLPADAEAVLREALPEAEIVDALVPLERLRAVKSAGRAGAAPRGLGARRRFHAGGLCRATAPARPSGSSPRRCGARRCSAASIFEYCLIAAGDEPQPRALRPALARGRGAVARFRRQLSAAISATSAAWAILGEPDAELEDLLAEIDEIQQAARQADPRRARSAGDLCGGRSSDRGGSPHRNAINFVAHGMGLISHEAPRLSSRAPVPYPGDDADKPLEAGMVISIETTMHHPRRGFIKLEDTVAVTETGWEAFGDFGRGWNRGKLGCRM